MLKGKNKNALIIPLLAVLSGFIVGGSDACFWL